VTTVLKTEDLRKQFGELTAVDDVSIGIDDSEITSIIGPNGAGKTTFYNLLTGVLRPTSGSIWLQDDGEGGLADITDAEPHEVAQAGLSRSYQITNIFEGLTVRENVRVARISHGDAPRLPIAGGRRRGTRGRHRGAVGADGAHRYRGHAVRHAESRRSGPSRSPWRRHRARRVPDGRADRGDEPDGGHRIVSLIRELDADLDATFVVTEHNMDVVTDISDRIVVLAEERSSPTGRRRTC